jgi:high-affinity Fe2+/Pb2+ permease
MEQPQGTAELHVGNNWLKLFGLDITHILVVIVVILVGVGLWQHQEQSFREAERRDEQSKTSFLEQHKITHQILGEVVKNQQAILKAITDSQADTRRALYMQTYVLTLDEQERKRLKLDMPPELRTGYKP